jgi:hypothetical protein
VCQGTGALAGAECPLCHGAKKVSLGELPLPPVILTVSHRPNAEMGSGGLEASVLRGADADKASAAMRNAIEAERHHPDVMEFIVSLEGIATRRSDRGDQYYYAVFATTPGSGAAAKSAVKRLMMRALGRAAKALAT